MNSIWSDTGIARRNPLSGDCTTEIAVIGGGMAGILTAYYLHKKGKQVMVLEANRVGSGQTSGTTAKITSQHNLIYEKLIQHVGMTQAGQYAAANQTAVREFKNLIQQNSIFCAYEELPSYLYSTTVSEPLRREADAARKLGIAADFVSETELPFSIRGAVRFDNQAQFHPMEFLQHLSMPLTIYEKTTVMSVNGNKLRTNHGTVTAESIVFACHYPFINVPGFYFTRLYQKRSYVLALRRAPRINGMYLGIEKEGLSFRQAEEYLLIGGRGHRTGEIPAANPYKSLQAAASHLFPEAKTAAHWSAQDCMSVDSIPYIGQFASSKPDWYVATGFNKWGMSSSMVSAMILSDLICGRDNPYKEVFSPRRFHLKAAARDGVVHLGESVKGLTLGAANPSARCPHLGCKLSWNPAEHTWECPCHGSRFHHSGELLSGPAQTDAKF